MCSSKLFGKAGRGTGGLSTLSLLFYFNLKDLCMRISFIITILWDKTTIAWKKEI